MNQNFTCLHCGDKKAKDNEVFCEYCNKIDWNKDPEFRKWEAKESGAIDKLDYKNGL